MQRLCRGPAQPPRLLPGAIGICRTTGTDKANLILSLSSCTGDARIDGIPPLARIAIGKVAGKAGVTNR
jgi:hypothetical protein